MLVKVLAGILLTLLAIWAIVNVINIIMTAKKRKMQRKTENATAPQYSEAAVAETDNAENTDKCGAVDETDQKAEALE